MTLSQVDGMEEQRQFEMTIVLTRKLGISINKVRPTGTAVQPQCNRSATAWPRLNTPVNWTMWSW